MKKYKVYFRAIEGTRIWKLSCFTQKPVTLEEAEIVYQRYLATGEHEAKIKEI